MQRQQSLIRYLETVYENRPFRMEFAASDADFRRYFRAIFEDGESIICMDAPPEHFNMRPFLMVQQLFQSARVPQILALNEAEGFMLLEDFGRVTYLTALQITNDTTAHKALLLEASNELILLQKNSKEGRLPDYSREKLHDEMQLFVDWFVARELGRGLNETELQLWERAKEVILNVVCAQTKVYVHRDFTVRNIMLMKGKPGILDFQDAVFGPTSYDMVSLLRDAFIEWDEELVLDILIRYWEKARAAGVALPAAFDDFYRDFELTGVQRHLKVAGIFARLHHRDGKSRYLAEIPRFLQYLRRTSRRYHELSPLYRLLNDLLGEDAERQMGYTF